MEAKPVKYMTTEEVKTILSDLQDLVRRIGAEYDHEQSSRRRELLKAIKPKSSGA